MGAEKSFESKVRKFLNDEGCYEIKFFANAYTKKGIPDLLVCCNGYFIGVEVKAPNGKPSDLQLWNIRKINEAGGIGLILYPDQFDDFKKLIWYLQYAIWYEAQKVMYRINERWEK